MLSKVPIGNASSHRFQIHYRGSMADHGMLEAQAFAESLLGAAKLYEMLAHYSELGHVPRKRRQFAVYTRATVLGNSVDQELILQSLSYSQLITGGIIGAVIKELVAAIVRWWTGPADRVAARKQLDIILEQQRNQHQVTNRILDIQERLIDRLPGIANDARPHLDRLVRPLEQASCESIVQFPEDAEQVVLVPEDVGAIRENAKRTKGVQPFRIRGIRRLNTQTRNCSVVVDDDDWKIHRVLFGEIDDPRLALPNNDYTRVMHTHLPATIFAEADVWNGHVVRLYIKGIRVS